MGLITKLDRITNNFIFIPSQRHSKNVSSHLCKIWFFQQKMSRVGVHRKGQGRHWPTPIKKW